MFKRTMTAALIFGAAALAPPAQAQTVAPCMARGDLIDTLNKKYSETMIGGGLQNARQLLEIWRSEETGSFTVIVTNADGLSCIVASGQHWQAAMMEPEGVAG